MIRPVQPLAFDLLGLSIWDRLRFAWLVLTSDRIEFEGFQGDVE